MPDDPNLHEFTVVPALPRHKQEAHEQGRSLWAPGISPETHRGWKEGLRQASGSGGRYNAWSLVRRGDEQGDWYSFLETWRRDAIAKTGPGGELENVNVYAVTFVQTLPRHRRKGYAHRLLRTIHYLLAPPSNIPAWPQSWGAPPSVPESITSTLSPASASYLSSVAAKHFYHRAWVGPDPPPHVGDGAIGDEEAVGGKEEEGEATRWRRPGWMTNPTSENSILTCPLSSLDLGPDEQGWSRLWIYEKDLPSLQPGLGEMARRKLRGTQVAEGETVIRIDPLNPGVLGWLEPSFLTGANPEGRGWTPSNQPVGVRFYPSLASSSEATPPVEALVPAFEPQDPICLFYPHTFAPSQLSISLLSLPPALYPNLLNALREIARSPIKGPACTYLSAWGMESDHDFTNALVGRGGQWGLRTEEGEVFLPFGVVSYGRAGRGLRMEGLELWAWV